MADTDRDSGVSELDLELEAEDEEELHPNLTAEQIASIQNEAQAEDDAQDTPQNDAQDTPQSTRKRRYREVMTSEAWNHFTKGVVREDGSYDAVCNYCDNSKVGVWTFDQAICRRNLAIMVIVHEYPFSIVDHYYFRLFLKSVQPQFKLISRNTLSLVLDNASSNDACIKELLNGQLREALPVDGSVFHQRCGCHILNLVVQDGISVVDEQIEKIRETMKYLRHSQARMERFKLATSQAKISFKKPAWDVATRWNSTYLMLELALYLRPAIDRYACLDKNFKKSPNDMEWEAMEALMDCLKIFYTATLKFSGSRYPTLNYFFPELCEVYEYLETYSKSLQSQADSSSRTPSQSQRSQACASSTATVTNIRAGLKSLLAEKKTSDPVKSELEQYLTEPLDHTALEEDFDILAWWKLKVSQYPVLSRLARDILAVPASTVASESTFSTSGRTLSVVRNTLNDESIEALICAQDWLRIMVKKLVVYGPVMKRHWMTKFVAVKHDGAPILSKIKRCYLLLACYLLLVKCCKIKPGVSALGLLSLKVDIFDDDI
ncbi:hypothetical protein LUZ61_013879 [Rhynchospora tenuis]|uniref:HAT C-terminal dimerisation domain-containing protein n=1 Tax=Rhynchospora tenuis TaxID=198213 RepID=A0AAD5W9K4_9POAL|nr:hypothetical protein LUZ61_013879 [Rhynchospora tenuis]